MKYALQTLNAPTVEKIINQTKNCIYYSLYKEVQQTAGLLGINGNQAIFVVQNRFKNPSPSDITEAELNTLFEECMPFFD